MKHVALVPITPELLAQAICFPDGTAIVSVRMVGTGRGAYVLMTIEHDDLRGIDDDAVPPEISPRFQRDEANLRPAVTFVNWGQDT